MWFKMNPKSRREDPTELARPSGVVTTGTTGASAETESGTEGGEAPLADDDDDDDDDVRQANVGNKP